MPKGHPEFRTRDDKKVPVFPKLKTIDGYHYLRDSVWQDKSEADRRVEKLRKAGDAAQAFASGNPRFQESGEEGLYRPMMAAVYTVPQRKKIRLTEDSYVVEARKTKKPAKKPMKKQAKKPAKKQAKKPAKKQKAAPEA